MALISGVVGVFGRFAGRLLNSILGWATILLFGKVSGRKQPLLLAIAVGALVWVVLLVGVAVPDVGTFLLAFVPVPSFVSRDAVRIAMLVAAAALPLVGGLAVMLIAEGSSRPKDWRIAPALLRGYPFFALLAVAIAVLGVVATVRKVRSLSRRWQDAHVAVIVKPGHYDEVADQLARVLDEGGIDVRREPAPRVLTIPPKVLARVAGRGLAELVPDRLLLLKGRDVELLLYPSDVALSGSREMLALSRALVADRLTEAPAYFTSSAEAERLEDELREVSSQRDDQPAGRVRERLRSIDQRLFRLLVPWDEWEVLYRERLRIERDLLAADSSTAHSGPRPVPQRDAPTRS